MKSVKIIPDKAKQTFSKKEIEVLIAGVRKVKEEGDFFLEEKQMIDYEKIIEKLQGSILVYYS